MSKKRIVSAATESVSRGQPAWNLKASNAQMHLTRLGGHLGGIRFKLGRKWVEPYSNAPWSEESSSKKWIPLLQVLRGDFFCMPFGHGPAWHGENHPPHGETANRAWKIENHSTDSSQSLLTCSLKTSMRATRVTKTILLKKHETVIYSSHRIEGLHGPVPLGHHAMLNFQKNGPGRISTSKLRFGQVLPVPFENPSEGGYSSLKTGAVIKQLNRVPLACGGVTDLTHYPARAGFEDLVMLRHYERPDFAWTAVTFPTKGFVWFSLKNPALLASTVLWHSNGGRHYIPWSGRHRGILGIEDVTSYFHLGLAASLKPNFWNNRGIPTSLKPDKDHTLTIPYIQGVAAIPKQFSSVTALKPVAGGIMIYSKEGQQAEAALDLSFLTKQ